MIDRPTQLSGPTAKPAARAGGAWLRRIPLTPALVFTIAVTQVPFLMTVWYSLQDYRLNYPTAPRNFPTLDNYRAIFGDPTFRVAALHTVILTVAAVGLSLVLGVGIALLLNRPVFGRKFLRTLIISPFLVMSTAAALVWKFSILDTSFGILNWFVSVIGLKPEDWIGTHPLLVIIAFLTWQWTPFIVLIALAGLQSQGEDVLEAAQIDGAKAWQTFRWVTLPHLRPYIELGILLGSIYIVQAFDSIYIITQGGPSTDSTNLPYYVYEKAFQAYDIGQASASSVIVVVATIIVATVALRLISGLFTSEGMGS